MEIYRSNRACGCMRCRFRGIMGAVVLMTVGVLLLMHTLDVSNLNFHQTWPLLLISIGVVKMLQRSASIEGHIQPPMAGVPFPTPPVPPMQPASTAMATAAFIRPTFATDSNREGLATKDCMSFRCGLLDAVFRRKC